jgi:DNA-binding transcriptional LysR family regulator
MTQILQIRTFIQVARAGNFSEGARQLGVVPSMVLKRIAQLEERLGVKLFHRTTRSMRLTDAGELLLDKATTVLAEWDDVLQGVGRTEEKIEGLIRVIAPTSLNHLFLNQLWASFMEKHPRVRLDVRLEEKSLNPNEEDCDIAISGHAGTYTRVAEIALAAVNPVLCATPTYFKTHQRPEQLSDLSSLDCLVYRPQGAYWQFESARGPRTIELVPRFTADDNYTLLQATLANNGIAVLPRFICGAALKKKQLEVVLQNYKPLQNWFKASVPERKMKLVRIQALVQHLQHGFKNFDL